MLKEKDIVPNTTISVVRDGVEYSESYLIAERCIRIMEGRLLTLVELLGLPEQQSEAMKSEVRNLIWGGGFLKYGKYMDANEVANIQYRAMVTGDLLAEK